MMGKNTNEANRKCGNIFNGGAMNFEKMFGASCERFCNEEIITDCSAMNMGKVKTMMAICCGDVEKMCTHSAGIKKNTTGEDGTTKKPGCCL